MNTVETIPELRQAIKQLERPLGLVPTMGYLHEGHLSLVRLAREQSASVVTSIFVNPTQFGPNEDLDAYPRDIPKDLALLEAEGVDLVWMPSPEIMYPEGFQSWVDVAEVTQVLEGAQRPGHFRGVTTIVAKLFNAVQPDKAFFGQKDAQQVAVIEQMVRDLDFPLEIVVGPIQREPDGLALSSRNVYLDIEQRKAATVLNRALKAAKASYEAGERSGDVIRQTMTKTIQAEPLAKMQYVSCAHPRSLQELKEIVEDGTLLSMAVFVGKTRLIDNLVLGPNH
ncbi:MAG: pantoate--beta-alanine ligase [Chloroflexi bacterium]|nr:MAG: pantoate--beta-alanine ligase [Chloroflexota bacterium]MBL1194327.1 pantoate--beta-alanine ligase [Chloroflexota bacterium]NOH11617.1 pantoate--beta-alanine ligase [Chloroflexota bacterium]